MIYYTFNFFKTKGAKLLPKYGSPAFASKCLDLNILAELGVTPCINTFAADADKWDIFELTMFAQISPSDPTTSDCL